MILVQAVLLIRQLNDMALSQISSFSYLLLLVAVTALSAQGPAVDEFSQQKLFWKMKVGIKSLLRCLWKSKPSLIPEKSFQIFRKKQGDALLHALHDLTTLIRPLVASCNIESYIFQLVTISVFSLLLEHMCTHMCQL